MRALVVGIFCVAVQGAFAQAQTALKQEPLFLSPGQTALVDDGSCNFGKVMKVTGAMRGLRRKRECVLPDTREEAALIEKVQ